MSTPLNTRETLLHRLRDQDDEGAWEEFVSIYRPYGYRVVQNLGVDPASCEDVLQDVMLIAWHQLPSFEYDAARGRFRSWFVTIIQRRVYALWKKSGRENGEPLPDTDAVDPEVDAIFQKEWERYVSDLAWERIKDRFSPTVLAAFKALASGQKGEDVAAELGLSVNSVYVYKKRVLAALRKEIAYLDC
ncbi:MAG: RNA polymerase sigma factor [Verrucomicrobiales bacterium]|nr:RNA polymerase sigma factor [Verrucomicrobiales bacterium]